MTTKIERSEVEKAGDVADYGVRVAAIREAAFAEGQCVWAIVQLGPQWHNRDMGTGADSWSVICVSPHESLVRAVLALMKPDNRMGVTRHVLPFPLLGNSRLL